MRAGRHHQSKTPMGAEPIIAASLGVRGVRMVVDPSRHDHVTLSITRRDPFESTAPPCPLITTPNFDAWGPIPVGVDEEGEIVTLSLPEHNVLFGAEPGGGKSVALSVLVAAFALDPTVTLWLFDGKLVELAPWLDCAKRFVPRPTKEKSWNGPAVGPFPLRRGGTLT